MRRYGSWPVIAATVLGSALAGLALAAVLLGIIQAAAGDTLADGRLSGPWTLFVAIAATDGALLAVVYTLLVRRGVADWRGLGLRRGRTRHPGLTGLGYALLFVAVSSSLSLLLARLGVEQDQAARYPVAGGGTLAATGILVGGVIFAPLAEELFFRGFVQQAMSERKGPLRGLLYSSALFGAVHGDPAAFLPLMAGGLVLGVSYRRTGTLWVPIVAHAANNAFALSVLLLAG